MSDSPRESGVGGDQGGAQKTIQIGPNQLIFGDDNVAVFRLSGKLEREHAAVLVKEISAFQNIHPNLVLLVDLTLGDGLEPDARKLIIAGVTERPYAVGFIRAKFGVRALIGMMLNASRLLGMRYPHKFVDSEAEGRSWAKSLTHDWI